MKIYIFGAGASRGSQDGSLIEDNKIAPLVNELFDSKYEQYAKDVFLSANRIRNLSDKMGDTSLEEWLSSEWTTLQRPHGKEALAFGKKQFGDIALYIWWLMANVSETYNEDNGYHKLLEKLAEKDDKEEQVFINFNYDLLLDKALAKVYGYDLSGKITNYTTLNYLKPHGSVNWFLKRRVSDPRLHLADAGSDQLEITLSRVASNMFKGESIQKNLVMLDPLNKNIGSIRRLFDRTFQPGSYGFPLVMLPLASKMYDLVDDFMNIMNAEFARVFTQATEVYVIGYRANDDIFKKMTSHIRKNTPLHVIGTDTAEQIQTAILDQEPKFSAGNVYSRGFKDFVENL